MTTLFTGASGFVGYNILSYLRAWPVKILTREQLLKVSVDDFQAVDSVVHLAGKAHDLKKVAQPEEYYEVNFELTKKLYDAFLLSQSSKFIFISSVKAVADSVRGALSEEFTPNPQTHYGKSKLMAEEYIQSQPLPAGKSFYILRPCMIHGPGNKGNLNLLHSLVAHGIPYPLGGFENKRSFLSVENLCYVIKEILERTNFPSGIYHLADDESLSTNDLVRLLSQALEKHPRIWKIAPPLINAIARAGDKFNLPLNTERLRKLTENYVVNNQKIKLALKKELPLSAREGILKTARAFKNA